jgi:hypothetical protein
VFFLDKKSADHAMMAYQEKSMRIHRFMDDLSPDDAYTFFQILDGISDSDNSTRTASYLAGQMHTILRSTHKVCVSCGEKHDEQFHMPKKEEDALESPDTEEVKDEEEETETDGFTDLF